MIRFPVAFLLAAALAAGGAAVPGIAAAQDMPSYAQPVPASQDETITGRIQNVVGAFALTVLDDRGFVDNVQLHQGTIINPRGLTLAAGMSVTIVGHNAGPYFQANEIDTPYSYTGAPPAPAYYGPGWWYPGFDYGFGPAFGLGLGFGFGTSIVIIHEPFRHHHPWDGHPWNWTGHVPVAPPNNGRVAHYRYPQRANPAVTTGTPAYRTTPQTATPQTVNVYRTAPAAAQPGRASEPVRSAPAMRAQPSSGSVRH